MVSGVPVKELMIHLQELGKREPPYLPKSKDDFHDTSPLTFGLFDCRVDFAAGQIRGVHNPPNASKDEIQTREVCIFSVSVEDAVGKAPIAFITCVVMRFYCL